MGKIEEIILKYINRSQTLKDTTARIMTKSFCSLIISKQSDLLLI